MGLQHPPVGVAASLAKEHRLIDTGDQCVYYVRYDNTPVQENPDTDSVPRKYKNAGARVTGPRQAAYDTESRVWFTAVDCSCAIHGFAWIRSYWPY
jgi:hypothetical protein